MLRTFLTLFLLINLNLSFAQINYDDFKHKFITYCGTPDSAIINRNVSFIDSMSSLDIEKGLDDFLLNAGQAYYSKYLFTKSNNDLILSINAYTRLWEQFNSTNALYNLVVEYAWLDCFMARKYIKLLENKIHLNELDSPELADNYVSQINIIKDHICSE